MTPKRRSTTTIHNEMKMNRLLKTKTQEEIKTNCLEDLIYVFALNIEDAMLAGGAKPGVNYSFLDIYKMAIPFANEFFKRNYETMNFAIGYPDSHPLSSGFLGNKTDENLLKSVDCLDLPTRAKNILLAEDIYTIGDLIKYGKHKLKLSPNCGVKTIRDIEEALDYFFGLSFDN